MSQKYEDCIQLFCVRCEDVGLECNCTIYAINEENVFDSTISHMFENHAIKLEEMTTCMKLKIKENVSHTPLSPTSRSAGI